MESDSKRQKKRDSAKKAKDYIYSNKHVRIIVEKHAQKNMCPGSTDGQDRRETSSHSVECSPKKTRDSGSDARARPGCFK